MRPVCCVDIILLAPDSDVHLRSTQQVKSTGAGSPLGTSSACCQPLKPRHTSSAGPLHLLALPSMTTYRVSRDLKPLTHAIFPITHFPYFPSGQSWGDLWHLTPKGLTTIPKPLVDYLSSSNKNRTSQQCILSFTSGGLPALQASAASKVVSSCTSPVHQKDAKRARNFKSPEKMR